MPSPFRMPRRETFSTLMCFSKPRSFRGLSTKFMSHSRRCEVDRVLDALVAAATADVAGHRFADLVMRWLGVLHQERSSLHDLAGLAEAALGDVDLAPGLLDRMIAVWMQALDRGDLAAGDVVDRRDAGANGFLVDDDSAGAAQGLA